jgi:hypothetical protein
MKNTTFCLLALLLSGCGTIESHRKLEQPTDTTLTTSIGGTIFRLNRTGDLPNAFGGADIYGGKVNKGFAELKLKAIKENGTLELQSTDENAASSETTMDRYGPKAAVNVDQTVNVGSNQPSNTTVFEYDPKKQKDLVIAGIKVSVIKVEPYSIHYTLQDTQQAR